MSDKKELCEFAQAIDAELAILQTSFPNGNTRDAISSVREALLRVVDKYQLDLAGDST